MAQPRRRKHDQADAYGRIVQVVAIIGVVVMAAIDLPAPETSIPAWIYGGMLGIAIGAKPDDLRNFTGRK